MKGVRLIKNHPSKDLAMSFPYIYNYLNMFKNTKNK